MANSKRYDIELRTSSSNAVPEELNGDLYWYDTGEKNEDQRILKDNSSSNFAIWHDGSKRIISASSDIGGSPTDYFYETSDTMQIDGFTVPNAVTLANTNTPFFLDGE